MKIEKVSDNQIRCTLTKNDLADRQLKLSELAYGTEKAKALFRDMMQQAAYEFGFEAEDIPLMIEAIPLSSECIILIITKVEYPEELDTRFSKFAPSAYEEAESDHSSLQDIVSEGADDIIDFFKKIREEHSKSASKDKKDFVSLHDAIAKKGSKDDSHINIELTKLYSFTSLDDVIRVAKVLDDFYFGANTLYKDSKEQLYLLTVSKGKHTPEEFNKVCNIISEYSHGEKYTDATGAFLKEHLEILSVNDALQKLASL